MRMKNAYTAVPLLALALLALSCNKQEDPRAASGIHFAAPLQTRATDAASTSAIYEVRDWNNNSTMLIDNTLEYSSGAWGYGTDASYPWGTGSHLFFGWLQTDGSYSSNNWFGSALTISNNVLTVPAKTMNNSVRQYDFQYSDVVARSASDNDYSDVPLIFNHMFAQIAISFEVSNLTADDEHPIYLKRVFLNENLKNRKSASIEFAAEGDPTVTYTASSDGYFATPVDLEISGYTKGSTPIDVLSQVQSSTKSFYYTWPMTEDELQNVITVEYTVPDETDTRTSVMSFPSGTTWDPGNKYLYTISYMGGILKIVQQVLPWEYVEATSTVEEQAAVAYWMGWDSTTCSVENITDVKFITDSNGILQPIHGIFRINAPTNCTFYINMTQNASSYTVSPASGTIGTDTGDIAPGTNIDFYITPGDRPAAGQPDIESGISFSIKTNSGREFSLDSELQRDGGFNIIIPAL